MLYDILFYYVKQNIINQMKCQGNNLRAEMGDKQLILKDNTHKSINIIGTYLSGQVDCGLSKGLCPKQNGLFTMCLNNNRLDNFSRRSKATTV